MGTSVLERSTAATSAEAELPRRRRRMSGWHFVRVEEKLRASLVPVTAFAAKTTSAEPAMGEEFWGIGLRGKDEDFKPYFMASRISLVQSLPERTGIALAEVAAPGLPVFDRSGVFAGVAVGGFGQTYLQYSRNDRGLPVMLMIRITERTSE